jgi:hypothetical protein
VHGFEQPALTEPVNPFERGAFDGFKRPPWALPIDDFGLVKAAFCIG